MHNVYVASAFYNWSHWSAIYLWCTQFMLHLYFFTHSGLIDQHISLWCTNFMLHLYFITGHIGQPITSDAHISCCICILSLVTLISQQPLLHTLYIASVFYHSLWSHWLQISLWCTNFMLHLYFIAGHIDQPISLWCSHFMLHLYFITGYINQPISPWCSHVM